MNDFPTIEENETRPIVAINPNTGKQKFVFDPELLDPSTDSRPPGLPADTWHKSQKIVYDSIRIYHKEIEFIPRKDIKEQNTDLPDDYVEPEKPPTREKGDITRFSRKSRFRMLRKMNRIQTRKISNPIFITLTARQGSMDAYEFQQRFNKYFLPALKEKVPGACYMWKLEPHKSGKPHYHMIVWSLAKNLNIGSRYYKHRIRVAWRQAIDQHDRAAQLYACKIESLNTEEQAYIYISKYLAKENDRREPDFTGRRWATSNNLPLSPITEIRIPRHKRKLLFELLARLLNTRNGDSDFIRNAMYDKRNFFVWLNPDEISDILRKLGMHAEANDYNRYLERGSPEHSQEEIDYLFDKYG